MQEVSSMSGVSKKISSWTILQDIHHNTDVLRFIVILSPKCVCVSHDN